MILQTAEREYRRWWKIQGVALFFLLLAAALAACGTGTHGGGMSSFPQGKLSLLHLPATFILPGQILSGSDSNLWFPAIAYANFTTSKPSGAIGRLAPAGQFQMFPLPDPDSYPTMITFASDGSVWFTVFQGKGRLNPPGDTKPSFAGGYNEIGHLTPDGKFRIFALPSSIGQNASLAGIAAGPDGNLWFTENLDINGSTSQLIGRMTPAGIFSDFPLHGLLAYSHLRHIIAGPDGNLWFSIEGSDKDYNAVGAFGRITPQGAISIFPAGKYNVPMDMTIGPDQNLWFTTYQSVGRITMDGNISLFDPDPHASGFSRISLGGITTGPDGALWFSTANVAVGRVTTTGTFTFYPFPPNTHFDNGSSSLSLGQLKGIVKGADGTLWLTDGSQIGHFV
jgi:streptogramin lyase